MTAIFVLSTFSIRVGFINFCYILKLKIVDSIYLFYFLFSFSFNFLILDLDKEYNVISHMMVTQVTKYGGIITHIIVTDHMVI